ncbi:MAG: ABC transporter permease [Saccharospirillaceae bacterium]|nr:hypothetical protein A3759_29395 [Thalassolituus sp. HI0120]KZZ48887.1 hypothetical protein A3759_17670 [Thalassolituus sp. HI0120]MCH2039336.1 ABC transporter permease [Saccharospirillaceae bacterium]
MKAKKVSYRDLFGNLVRAEIKVRYMGAYMGVLWSLGSPLLYIAVYYYVFTVVFPSPIENFSLYVVTGFIHWSLFSQIISQSSDLLVRNVSLLRKMAFPMSHIVSANFVTALCFWMVALIIYACAFHYLGGAIEVELLYYPIALFLYLIFIYGISLLLSVLYVYFRDVKHLIDVFLPLLFWLSPVVYSISLVPEGLVLYYNLNPVACYIGSINGILHENQIPDDVDWLIMFFSSCLAFWIGWSVFNRYSRHAIERL